MKLNKIYELRVQEHDSPSYVVIRPPLTVEFAIERSSWSSANEATFKIYNLAEDTRSVIFRDRYEFWEATQPPFSVITGTDGSVYTNTPGNVQFYAGYERDGKNLSLIFNGRLMYAHSTRRDTEWVTELECQDFGVFQYQKTSALTLAKGVNKREIIAALYRDLGQGEGVIGDYFDEPYSEHRGVALQGQTIKLLQEITEGKFFNDLGVPISLGNNEAFKNPNFSVLSKDTGLLNLPIKSNVQVVANLMFTPEIVVGQYLEIKTGLGRSGYDGEYKVIGVKHAGIISGTHDSPTTTTVYLVELQNPSLLELPGVFND